MGPERVAAELNDRFRLLAGGARTVLGRHQTLLASIDWSHELLDAAERALFRRLGVFAGGFTLAAAESVGAAAPVDGDAVLDVLARLVNKSLVQLDESSAERYRLLETIRHYALDRLDEAGENVATRDRHLAWAVAPSERLEPEITNAHADASDQLEVEHANLRAALDWASSADRTDDLLRLVTGVGFFWAHRGYFVDSRRWMAAVDGLGGGRESGILGRREASPAPPQRRVSHPIAVATRRARPGCRGRW
jgi:predicted ATPase